MFQQVRCRGAIAEHCAQVTFSEILGSTDE